MCVRNARAVERIDKADVVIDATGTYGQANGLGPGGLPAIGQASLASEIESGMPDIAGADREHYAGRSVWVVAGHSAATNVLALAAPRAASGPCHLGHAPAAG